MHEEDRAPRPRRGGSRPESPKTEQSKDAGPKAGPGPSSARGRRNATVCSAWLAAGGLIGAKNDDDLSGARLRQRVRIGGLLLADVELGGHVARLVLGARLV